MTHDSFEQECDRLSRIVDDVQYERLRWSRVEGPMLARLVELAGAVIESRPDFELTDEGSTGDIKRFVIKVHGNRIAGITITLEGSRAVLSVNGIERSRYQILDGPPVSAEFQAIDEPWMALALQELLSRVQG